jgi:hypothetical protein
MRVVDTANCAFAAISLKPRAPDRTSNLNAAGNRSNPYKPVASAPRIQVVYLPPRRRIADSNHAAMLVPSLLGYTATSCVAAPSPR